ncbi:MAG: tripartite tricarboxylate transporter substrate binding protein [Limnohabitans sp.]|nr:tripartite tricarboxylate transporter substrate binding protein [Limnohabitans sp.]
MMMKDVPYSVLNFCRFACVLFLMHVSTLSYAADYPTKPIRLIVPFPPGGAGDIVARPLALAMSQLLKQTVFIENKVGASALIGADAVAKSTPDGYTLALVDSAAMVINPAIYKNLPYRPVEDFTPISMVASSPFMIVTHPSMGVRNLSELIAAGKQRSDLNYGSSGNGSLSHLTTEWLKSSTGARFRHIPYKGAAVFSAVVAGEVHLASGSMLGLVPLVRAGRIVPIAVTSKERSPMLPDLPTVAESGIPGFDSSNWFALVGPAGLPPEIIAKLTLVAQQAARAPEMLEILLKNGASSVGGDPKQLAQSIENGLKKWSEVVKASGAQID